jgi:hypothetical protein
MKTVDYTDENGFVQRALLPDGVSDEDAPMGIPVGIDLADKLEAQGMPFETARRLQNELRRRGFWTDRDVHRARATEEIFAALQSAYRIDVAAIINLLREVTTK